MASTSFDTPLLEIGLRLDETRQFLAYLDNLRNHPRSAELARTSRAWAYVAIAAAFEEFVRAFTDEVTQHINRAGLPALSLKLGIVSLMNAGAFDAAAAGRNQAMWDRRLEVMRAAESAVVVPLLQGVRPLDGRTIRMRHLQTIWGTFEFPGSPVPGPLHALALKDLADGRNEVAHGNSDPVAFGRTKTYADVLRRIAQVEDIAVHMAAAAAAYVAQAGYRR
ncbi:MAG TPA: hypothetical protein VFT50_02740 [Baekduia sp.]|nr:hypothetical protein [Baekduia sp.]